MPDRFQDVAQVPNVQALLADLAHDLQPPHKVLQQILHSVSDVFHLEAGVAYVADYSREELICLAHQGCDAVSGEEGPPRYRFADVSLVTKVFHEKKGYFSREPWADPTLNQQALQFFRIQVPVVGVPLIYEGRTLGVLVAWGEGSRRARAQHVKRLEQFAFLAADRLAISVAQEKHSAVLGELSAALTRSQSEVSQEAALRDVMEALQAFPFDRVRLFEYKTRSKSFIPVDSLGMHDAQRFLQVKISAERNPYAPDT